jgi:hypothetical protein
VRIVLLACYDQGHQPFGLAGPAAELRQRGHDVYSCDISVGRPDMDRVAIADLIAFYLPMHTATRLAVPWIRKARSVNGRARLAAYGLYASLNQDYLRSLGVGWFARPALARREFPVPDRADLKPLERYAKLQIAGEARTVGYTEASLGCKHKCRHCPVVPVYQGRFRVVSVETVLADVRQQVHRGARHVTFGDPDFFNGPGHARRLVEALARDFAGLTYDVTIKVEHLLRHRDLLPLLRDTGCLFVTSAVESFDDAVLARLEKGHTRADFLTALELVRAVGLTLAPTFIAFTPWTTRISYRDFLRTIHHLELVENTASVQLALRLLITQNSRLLELPDLRVGEFQPASLLYSWAHEDPEMDLLAARLIRLVAEPAPRREMFARVWSIVFEEPLDLVPRAAIPYMDEPWYC